MNGRVKGWCPSLLKPMQAADGWLLRLKPPLCRLPAAAARRIADAAVRLGNGRLELTQRAGLQLRGFEEAGIEVFARLALDLGLAASDPEVEARRNLVAPPLLGFDDNLNELTQAIAETLESAFLQDERLAELPDKFGFLVDGGGLLPLEGAGADIALRCRTGRIELGGSWALSLPVEALADTALALAAAFVRYSRGRYRRMQALLDAEGPAPLLQALNLSAAASPLGTRETAPPSPGLHRSAHRQQGAALVFWPFGALSAEQLAQTAELAVRHGDGLLRLTPWRALALAGVSQDGWLELQPRLRALGGLVEARDPLLRIDACPGLGACPEARQDSRGLAGDLAQTLAEAGPRVHVSGCAKGCAHPAAAALTLVGEEEGWALVRDGRADAPPLRRKLRHEEILELARHA